MTDVAIEQNSPSLLAGYVDRNELADLLRISTKTVARYEAVPDGLPSVKVGPRKLYRLAAVRKWLEARETRPNPRRSGRSA